MERLNKNINIPDYIRKDNPLETCYHLINLQNDIKTVSIIKQKIGERKVFISLDTESYEKNHDYLTEVGWVIFDKTEKILKKEHYIIQEYMSFHNGKYVEDNKFNYDFGESKTKSLIEVIRLLNKELNSVDYIVGQGINNDIKDLEKLGVNLTKFEEMKGIYKNYGIIDTQYLYSGCFHDRPISLKKGLDKLHITYRYLHNAGNDAYYTMKYFFELIRNFDINDIKNKRILDIKIPDEYNEEDYIRYKREKDERRKREKELKKLKKNRKIEYYDNYSDHIYENDDYGNDNYYDYYDYYDDFNDNYNYYDDSNMGIGEMLGIYDSDELDEYIAKYGFY